MGNIIDSIGLDIDGVLIDLQEYQYTKGVKYFCKKFHKKPEDVIINWKAYDIEDIFGCTRKERMGFWRRYIWKYSLLQPARKGASEFTHKWHKEGRTVDIITSRVYVTRKDAVGMLFRMMVKIWLRTQNIYFDRIKFCSEEESATDKALACKEFGTKLMVEDKVNNIIEISKNVITACFQADWNKGYNMDSDNIFCVKSLYEIDTLISKLETYEIKTLR